MSATIRLATAQDADSVLAIYAPYIRETPISFELVPPPLDEMRERITKTLERMPWLICEIDGSVRGYAYASPFRTRAAYQWSVEVSIYIHTHSQRRGVGRALYATLFEALVLQGFYNAYAGITLPNPASVGMHEALGFRPCGVFVAAGYKHDRWHDVGWWQRDLQPRTSTPEPPLDLQSVLATPQWAAILASGPEF